ncbi:MAG: hypothetical protein BroJett011_39320 [Chloroflexota bacterium]|nr:MAG: hypothetical protein BroJett011_39320 [Chloroflexota bacterium]
MSLSLDLQSIILLLFFVAPGFLFTRTYTAYRPRYYRTPDAFEQVVLAVVGSAIIHGTLLTGIALGLAAFWLVRGELLSVSDILGPPMPIDSYPLPVLAFVILMAILYLAVSLILARRFATFLGYRTAANRPRWWRFLLDEDPPEPFLLWHTMLQVEPLKLNLIPPHLHIQMRNGEYFEGDLHSMRLVGDEENTVELALRNVCHRPSSQPSPKSRANLPASDLQPLPNQVILLKSTDILWLTRNDIPS